MECGIQIPIWQIDEGGIRQTTRAPVCVLFQNSLSMKSIFLLTLLLDLCNYSGTTQQVNHDMVAYIKSESQQPSDYVVSRFATHDVIFLAEKHLVRQNLHFVQQLIPALHKGGVYNLGMEFGAYEDQARLDSLILAPAYNENVARDLMFHYNVTWGYQEYIDLYRIAWELNRSLPKNAKKFRIINLSYVFNWKGFNGLRSPETMQQVFPKGTADKFRAEVIETEVLQKGEKILCLVGTPHAFTRYCDPYYHYNADNFCAYDRGWLGNRLYDKYPGKVFSIMLHQPFVHKTGDTYTIESPCNGEMEFLMAQFKGKSRGFDLVNSPVGKMKDESVYSYCYKDFTLSQLFDGYIFLAPLHELKGCTPIYTFVNENNIQKAIEQFPDPDWHEPVTNLEEMRAFILANSQRIEKENAKL